MRIEVKTLTSVEYSDEGNLELTKKDFDNLDSIARILASKYNGWYGLFFDDIYDIVWEKISSLIKDGCRDYALIYRCCKNLALDIVRKAYRENNRGFSASDEILDNALYHGQFDSYDVDGHYYEGVSKWSPEFNNQYSVGKIPTDCFDFVELLNLFEKGSREWEWLYLVAIRNKIIDVDPRIYDKLFTDGHTVDFEVSKLMGYKHQSNNGYRAIKNRVQEKVASYLGLSK